MTSATDDKAGMRAAIDKILNTLAPHELANVQNYLDAKLYRTRLAAQVPLGADGKPVNYPPFNPPEK